jgi:hypothetical protein
MVIYHIDMVIVDIDMGYGLMIWEMTVSLRSISHIDMGYLITLELKGALPSAGARGRGGAHRRPPAG